MSIALANKIQKMLKIKIPNFYIQIIHYLLSGPSTLAERFTAHTYGLSGHYLVLEVMNRKSSTN